MNWTTNPALPPFQLFSDCWLRRFDFVIVLTGLVCLRVLKIPDIPLAHWRWLRGFQNESANSIDGYRDAIRDKQ